MYREGRGLLRKHTVESPSGGRRCGMRAVSALFLSAVVALIWLALHHRTTQMIRRVTAPVSPSELAIPGAFAPLEVAAAKLDAAQLAEAAAVSRPDETRRANRADKLQQLKAVRHQAAQLQAAGLGAATSRRLKPAQQPAHSQQQLAAVAPAVAAPALMPEQCTDLDCARRHESLEPSWAELSFQPAIDWRNGGTRGDCVAGEYEYIIDKYCAAPARGSARGSASTKRLAKHGELGWYPSESRLAEVDVHTSGLPQATFKNLVARQVSQIYTPFPHMSHPMLPTFENFIRFFSAIASYSSWAIRSWSSFTMRCSVWCAARGSSSLTMTRWKPSCS